MQQPGELLLKNWVKQEKILFRYSVKRDINNSAYLFFFWSTYEQIHNISQQPMPAKEKLYLDMLKATQERQLSRDFAKKRKKPTEKTRGKSF